MTDVSTIVDCSIRLDQLCLDIEQHCYRCGLRHDGVNVVFGEGDTATKLLCIGEGPGREENRLRRPFVGPTGDSFNRALKLINVPRSRLYITNIILCQPPGNRTPDKSEWMACKPRLQRQIELVRPKVLFLMGSPAGQALVDEDFRITRHRGVWTEVYGIPTIASFHPAAFLHQQSAIKDMPTGTGEQRTAKVKAVEKLKRDMQYFIDDLNAAVDRADELDPSVPLRVLEEL